MRTWPIAVALLVSLASVSAQVPDLPPVGPPDPPDLPALPVDPPGLPPVDPPVDPPGLPAYRIPDGSARVGAPIQEYEFQAWEDGQFIRDIPRDGFDLISLRAWEADHSATGAGVILRFEMNGGSLTGAYEAFQIDADIVPQSRAGEYGNTSTVSLFSADGMAWSSDQQVLSHEMERMDPLVDGAIADNPVSLGALYQHVIHVHVPYADLGAAPNMNLTHWGTHSYGIRNGTAVEVDMAPGGHFVAGRAELPEPSASGELDDASLSATAPKAPAYFLAGAGRHLDVEGMWAGNEAQITVTNPYNATSQEVFISAPASASATAGERASLAPNESYTFRFSVPLQSSSVTLQWEARSDLGGKADMEVTLPAAPPPPPAPAPGQPPSSTPGSEMPGPIVIERTDPVFEAPAASPDAMEGDGDEGASAGEDSPIGVWLLMGALIVAASMRRRA